MEDIERWLASGIKVTICRRETFCCAHRIARPEWDQAKNREVFGECSWKNYHGHNYVLEVYLTGYIDRLTGYVYDLRRLKKIIREVLREFDHRNLNEDVEEFREGLLPTTELLAVLIWKRLRERLPENYELRVKLWETEKNAVIFPP